MSDNSNSTLSEDRRHPATIVSWIALAIAILVAGYAIREGLAPSDFLPGSEETAGLPAIGEPAPNFSAIDAEGNSVSLSDFRGQPVWLNFWGSWCPPCRAETPDMIAAYEQLRDEGLEIVAVSLEEPSSDAFAYAERSGMEYIVLSDPAREAIDGKYRVRSFPTHIFIDEAGIVRAIMLRPMSTDLAIRTAQKIT